MVFFSGRVFFHRHWKLTGQQLKGVDHLYSTLPLPPVHGHSDTYLQLCMWDDYHIFLITPLVFNRLLLDEIYHLIGLLLSDVMLISDCLLEDLIVRFCYSNMRLETGRLKLASTITLVFQANRLTKCASQLRSKQYFSSSEFFRVTVSLSFRQL